MSFNILFFMDHYLVREHFRVSTILNHLHLGELIVKFIITVNIDGFILITYVDI